MTDVRLTSISESSLDDRLCAIHEALTRIADTLEKLVPNPYTGHP